MFYISSLELLVVSVGILGIIFSSLLNIRSFIVGIMCAGAGYGSSGSKHSLASAGFSSITSASIYSN
jgi:hypothetical protein